MTKSKTTRTAGTGGSTVVKCCQVCQSRDLEPVLFLGYLPPVNTMPTIGQTPAEQPSYPAQWLRCPRCQLLQLGLIVDPKILFPPEYPYTSGTTRILRENFAELYRECRELLALDAHDLVVDIGANDGTLLSNFAPHHRVLGIEPTNAGKLAQERGIPTLISFFNEATVAQACSEHGQAKVITATNVFAHIEDVHAVLDQLMSLLSPDGVFISESHYAHALIETLQYDTIYHEHLRYYSLYSLQFMLERHGLEVFHVKRIPTHGGSIRVYAARKGSQRILPSVAAMWAEEQRVGLGTERLAQFKRDVALSKMQLHALLADLKKDGARIFGVGAPSRASTLINYVGLDDGILDCVCEIKGSYKIGKTIPGTMIPVVDESALFSEKPDYALLLSWHIAEELIPKLAERGFKGKFIVPLPTPRVVEMSERKESIPAAGISVESRPSPMPLVSLILCTKNGMPYLPEAVESVRAQTYRNFELIIQDAASTDGSREYLQGLAGFPAVDMVSEPDGGIGDAYNRAVRRCQGEIIGSIDADNLLEPDALERIVRAFAERSEAAAIYGASHAVDAQGKILTTWTPPAFDRLGVLRCEVVPPFGQSFFSRRVCGARLRFEETLKTCADFDLWLRLSHLPIVLFPEVIGSVRQSDQSMTCRPGTYDLLCADKITALDRYLSSQPQNDLLPVLRRLAVSGVYAWAAESILRLEGRSERFQNYLHKASELELFHPTLRRLVQQSQEGQSSPPNVISSSHTSDPAAEAALLRERLGRMLQRGSPITEDELMQATEALSALFKAVNPARHIAQYRGLFPSALYPLLSIYLAEAWNLRNAPLATAMEEVFGLLTAPEESLAAAS